MKEMDKVFESDLRQQVSTNEYTHKPHTLNAYQVTVGFRYRTDNGLVPVQVGDYLIVNADGSECHVPKAKFEADYELSELAEDKKKD